ncbi:hypothetical protein LTR85_005087 [Meristemomyces frigidus]|nr:hypothetical protein LTR85_005087 [Meristemomyces frigidus]
MNKDSKRARREAKEAIKKPKHSRRNFSSGDIAAAAYESKPTSIAGVQPARQPSLPTPAVPSGATRKHAAELYESPGVSAGDAEITDDHGSSDLPAKDGKRKASTTEVELPPPKKSKQAGDSDSRYDAADPDVESEVASNQAITTLRQIGRDRRHYPVSAEGFGGLNRIETRDRLDDMAWELKDKATKRMEEDAVAAGGARPQVETLKYLVDGVVLLIGRAHGHSIDKVCLYPPKETAILLGVEQVVLQAYKLLKAYNSMLDDYEESPDIVLSTKLLDCNLITLIGKMGFLTSPARMTGSKASMYLKKQVWGDAKAMTYDQSDEKSRWVNVWDEEARMAKILQMALGLKVIGKRGNVRYIGVYTYEARD